MKSLLKLNLDNLGICTSLLCAVHCLITPFLIVLLPFAGLSFLEGGSFEIGVLILSFFIATTSLVVAYFKKHRNITPMLWAGVGFILFIIGKMLSIEVAEIMLSVIGGCFVIVAHYRNRQLINK